MIHNKLDKNGNIIEEIRVSTLQKTRGNGKNMHLLVVHFFMESGIPRRKNVPKLKKNIGRTTVIFVDLNTPSAVVIGV